MVYTLIQYFTDGIERIFGRMRNKTEIVVVFCQKGDDCNDVCNTLLTVYLSRIFSEADKLE